jgi:hypothetical protein
LLLLDAIEEVDVEVEMVAAGCRLVVENDDDDVEGGSGGGATNDDGVSSPMVYCLPRLMRSKVKLNYRASGLSIKKGVEM